MSITNGHAPAAGAESAVIHPVPDGFILTVASRR